MRILTKIATFLIATTVLASPVAGQDAPANQADDTISLGQEVQPADGVGTVYIGAEFDDWALRCVRAADGPDPCRLYQLLFDDQGNTVSEITMFNVTDSDTIAAAASVAVPLDTLLSRNLLLSVDGTIPKSYPYTYCNAGGCYARVGFTADDLERFKRGNEGKITIVPLAATDQTVDARLSLKGFTAAYDALVAQNAPE